MKNIAKIKGKRILITLSLIEYPQHYIYRNSKIDIYHNIYHGLLNSIVTHFVLKIKRLTIVGKTEINVRIVNITA